ncbi:MAG: ubiquinol-cytochrome c reductase iron-sulfur subunit [Candidatus Pelagibacter sp.]|nr:ubiquinol-cytochrome c reductase iron-sulfur subunit [Candidatus Pelagibacter sp.]OUV97314.1 MAG: ubiquinol-cytochrome c reductase iron-sulfur subunit [Candidatus Pelagibacter sp. TMED142]
MDRNNIKEKTTRRDFIYTLTATLGAVGAGATIWPIVTQMNPDSSVKALSSIEVDISKIEKGKEITVMWRGKPVFIKRRTPEEVKSAESINIKDLKHPEDDKIRVKKSEWLVVIGICTHLGCVPINGKGEYGGWFCPCHGSHYDTSGRIRKGPAPTNLEVPSYKFIDDNRIVIG